MARKQLRVTHPSNVCQAIIQRAHVSGLSKSLLVSSKETKKGRKEGRKEGRVFVFFF